MSASVYSFIEHVPIDSPDAPTWNEPVRTGEPVIITTGASSLSAGPMHIGGPGFISAIAGVRPSVEPLHKPRGWPAAVSATLGSIVFLPVLEGHSESGRRIAPEVAAGWVESGHSVYGKPRTGRGPMFVSNPDAKLPGWLLLAEIYAALEFRGIAPDSMPVNFRGAMGAMKTIGDILGADHVRMTFWIEGTV